MAEKKQIRQQILKKRDALSACERKNASEKIRQHILQHDIYKDADCLLLFASFGSEPDTFGIADKALQDRKKIYYPLVEGEVMEFYRVDSLKELSKGFHGILEPTPSLTKRFLLTEDANVLMLMPGVCFDLYGGRIGYGGGFYDKYLAKLETQQKGTVTTMALAFTCQVVDANVIPSKEHDKSPDYLVTPERVIVQNKI